MCSGDSDLILDGIHENILHLSYHDPVMQKTVSIHLTIQIHRDSFTDTFESLRNFCHLFEGQVFEQSWSL